MSPIVKSKTRRTPGRKPRKQPSVRNFFPNKNEPKLTRQALRRQQRLEEDDDEVIDGSNLPSGISSPPSLLVPQQVSFPPNYLQCSPSIPEEIPSSPSQRVCENDLKCDDEMLDRNENNALHVVPQLAAKANSRSICVASVSVNIQPRPLSHTFDIIVPFRGLDVKSACVVEIDPENITSPVTTDAAKDAPEVSDIPKHHNDHQRQLVIDEAASPVRASSRLSLARNRARRQTVMRNYSPIVVEIDDEDDDDDSVKDCVELDCVPSKQSRVSRPPRAAAKKRARPSSPRQEKSKPLHPFFTATASAVVSAKERPKRPRVPLELTDPWEYEGATLHINFTNSCHPYSSPLSILPPYPVENCAPSLKENVTFNYFPRSAAELTGNPVSRTGVRNLPTVVEREKMDSMIWSERYKREERLNVVSRSEIKNLVDWLQQWYRKPSPDAVVCLDEASDESDSDIDEVVSLPDEAIALVLGDTGVGKSTIVANAAHELGLSLLEINASVCRTGKLVRDVVKEALRTHRVSNSNNLAASCIRSKLGNEEEVGNSSFSKTLIVFEEVDELNDDEKGFWSSIQELVSSSDCRRPVICTASSFTSQMRQVLTEAKDVVTTDMERTFSQVKENIPLNPLLYNFVHVPRRLERQTAAILMRVMGSESVPVSKPLGDFLSLACRNDPRKAINLLQFWCASGLPHPGQATSASPCRTGAVGSGAGNVAFSNLVGIDIIQSTLCADLGIATFHVCADEHTSEMEERDGTDDWNAEDRNALDAWCESLDAFSLADNLRTVATPQVAKRCVGNGESLQEPCFDAEVGLAVDLSSRIDTQALQSCRHHLSFKESENTLFDIATETCCLCNTARPFDSDHVSSNRQVFSEHVAYLRSMAVEDEKNSTNASQDKSRTPLRRTRSRTRKGGFSTFELSEETVSFLKSTALR